LTQRLIGDLSHREIAEVMQTGPAAVRRNIFAPLKQLRTDVNPTPTPKGNP
jgi:DNA-directed RNA polymerase specialized sigma24 family protein